MVESEPVHASVKCLSQMQQTAFTKYYFSEKTRFDISWELSAKQKCQTLFSVKIRLYLLRELLPNRQFTQNVKPYFL